MTVFSALEIYHGSKLWIEISTLKKPEDIGLYPPKRAKNEARPLRPQDIKPGSDQAKFLFEESEKYRKPLKAKDVDELIELLIDRFYPRVGRDFDGEFIKHSTIKKVIEVLPFKVIFTVRS